MSILDIVFRRIMARLGRCDRAEALLSLLSAVRSRLSFPINGSDRRSVAWPDSGGEHRGARPARGSTLTSCSLAPQPA